jgi:O-antigen ligase
MPLASGKHFDRLAVAADWLAVAVAASLPLSTSATGILLVIWLVTLIPTLDWPSLRRELATPAGYLPVLLVVLGMLGTVWADVTWLERWRGLGSFFKLLVIPLLLVQFRRSDRALCVFGAFLAACVVTLLASTVIFSSNHLSAVLTGDSYQTVPWKNGATQSGEFAICIFGLLYVAIEAFERRRWWWLIGAVTVALGMVLNMFYVATGRTALVIIPILLLLLAFKKHSARAVAVLLTSAIVIGGIGWWSSSYLRDRTMQIWTDAQRYEQSNERNSSGERLEFWKKSVGFVVDALVIGHGTGTIPSLFAKAAAGQTGAAGSATTNPHNQTLAVAIQLGFVGALVLWGMWIAHLLLFRGDGLPAWIGLVIVAQNIVGSLFNSHLFDFGQGWIYVIGVGVAGGAALKNRAAGAPPS